LSFVDEDNIDEDSALADTIERIYNHAIRRPCLASRFWQSVILVGHRVAR
jgi:hypothetical protein